MGESGYFEGDVKVPVSRSSNTWKVILKFDREIKGFKVRNYDTVSIASFDKQGNIHIITLIYMIETL